MTTKKHYWGLLPPMPAMALAEAAKQSEALGMEGLWAIQLYGSPFPPLAGAAMVTTRLKLGTAVALAFTRSPLETACTALDLDLLSGGRLVLGIGPTLRFLNEDWHGVPYGKPLRICAKLLRWYDCSSAKAIRANWGNGRASITG
jgi:alkanesulfonate monooxygenase SsuD/methylene tetrahydromethanopterin reductase-like flavin-dependent oxidoreductase (luciferase family)